VKNSTDVVEKIISLQKHYHFGRAKIAMYLARCPDLYLWDVADLEAARVEPGCPPRSATSGTTSAGSGPKSSRPAISCRSM
jgi:hypothetical protein